MMPFTDEEPSSSKGITRADSMNAHCSQFKATATWNKIAKEFRENMPAKKRWRQFRSFDSSFTGKEATDFMLTILPGLLPNKKEITRESCTALLQKFADSGLFKYAWNDEKAKFQDNATLFVWNGDSTLNGICRTPLLMRRASSFNNGSIDRPRKCPTTPKPPDIKTADETWTTFELPKSPPKHKSSRNRRLSSSTGNLSLIGVEKYDSILSPRVRDRIAIVEEGAISPEKRDEQQEVEYGEIKRNKMKEYIYGEVGKKKDTVYGVIRMKKQAPTHVARREGNKIEDSVPLTPTLLRSSPVYGSFIKREDTRDAYKENGYEYVSFRRRNGMGQTTPSKGSKRAVQSSKEMKENDSSQVKSVISRLTPSRFKGKENDVNEVSPPPPPVPPPRKDDSIYSSIRIRPRVALTDNDEWNVYSTALSNRVRSLLGYTEGREKESVITWRIDGQHVKWSCKYHPMGKVVRAMKQSEDWPSSLTQQMDYLKLFPFHSKAVNVITYTQQQEVRVFRTVVAHLRQWTPLLQASVGRAFLRVINHFNKLSTPLSRPNSANSGSSGKSVRLETAFSIGSPTTRLLEQNSCSSLNVFGSKEDVYAVPTPFHARTTLSSDTVIPLMDSSPILTTLSHRHTLHSTPPQGPLRVDPKSGI
ncbi:hypothetical protein PENTCL1PPCAC_6633, partial [Pristionchus entomophagus]